jgi:hypothetical protein
MLTVNSIYQIFPVFIGFHMAPEFIQLTTLLRAAGQFLRAHTSAFSIISIDALGLQLAHLFEQWTTHSGTVQEETFVVTHPFHPLFQRKFALVMYRPCWGEDRVFFHHDDGRLTSIPALWTSLGAVDPFVWLAAGRAYFRVEDLIAVADLVEALNHQPLASGEQV